VSLQELEETVYWLELLVDSGMVKTERMAELLKEADALIAILVTSARTVKTRKKKQ
jgi:four helix bundle protein